MVMILGLDVLIVEVMLVRNRMVPSCLCKMILGQVCIVSGVHAVKKKAWLANGHDKPQCHDLHFQKETSSSSITPTSNKNKPQ